MTKIKFSLNTDSVKKAIKEIEKYKKQIEINSKEVVKLLCDFGFDICNAKIVEMNIYDEGNLANSVSTYYNEAQNRGFIKVSCDYAVFVEFGTGTKGAKSSYAGQAMSEIGYRYQGGTKYITLADGRIGWYYPTKDGSYRFTEGMPSRPFMYETGLEMRNVLDSIVKAVFK